MEILHPSGEAYDLPAGAALEITRTNPFFNEMGEQSLPVSLPLTARNKRLLGYINRPDYNRKPARELTVIIRDGIYQQPARQVIFGVTPDAIDTTFYFRNGDFYTRLKNLTMSEVFSQTIVFESVEELNKAYNAWCTVRSDMFAIFPVAVNDESEEGKYKILNRIDHTAGTGDSDKFLPLYNIKARTERRYDGSDYFDVAIPAGYYITPFVRVGWMLKTIFAHIGVTLNDNRFFSDPDLSELVVLNNTADAVASLTLLISDLLPAGNVADFLDILRKRFRCEYILNADLTADIRFMDDILKECRFTDLSKTVAGRQTFSLADNKRLDLTQEATTGSSNRIKYSDLINEIKYVQLGQLMPGTSGKLINYLCPMTRRVIRMGISGEKIISTAMCHLSDIDMDDSLLDKEELTLSDLLPEYIWFLNDVYRFEQYPYLGDYRCIRSVLNVSSSEETSMEDLESADLKWMLCYNVGTRTDSEGKWIYGGVDFYDDDGIIRHTLRTEGINGIYNRYHRSYDLILRNSLDDIEMDHVIPEAMKSGLSGVDPVMINNQPVLPDMMEYVVGAKTRTSCKWKSLKITPPADIPSIAEEEFPQVKYYWKRITETDKPHAIRPWIYVNGEPAIEYFQAPTKEEFEAGGKYHYREWDCMQKQYDNSWDYTVPFKIKVWLEAQEL